MKKILYVLITMIAAGCASKPETPLSNVITGKGMENFSSDHAVCEQKAAEQERNLWLMSIDSTEIPKLKKNAYNLCMQRKGYTGGDIKSN